MAHFARIEDGIVQEIIVVKNVVLEDENGIEQESIGSQFCTDTFGGVWVQTSYNGNFRGQHAGTGMTYDPVLDIFTFPAVVEEVTE
jgi:hypothetical protein